MKRIEVVILSDKEISWELCNELVAGEIETRRLIVSYFIHRLPGKYGDEILEDIKKANYDAGNAAGKNAAKSIGKKRFSNTRRIFRRYQGIRSGNC